MSEGERTYSQEQQLVDLSQQLFTNFFTTERGDRKPIQFEGAEHRYIPPFQTDTVFDVNTIEWNPTVAELKEMPEKVGELADLIGGTRRTVSFCLSLINRDKAGLLPYYEFEIQPPEWSDNNAGIILSDDRDQERIVYRTTGDLASYIRQNPFAQPIEDRPEAEKLRDLLNQRKTRVDLLIPATKWAINGLNKRKIK